MASAGRRLRPRQADPAGGALRGRMLAQAHERIQRVLVRRAPPLLCQVLDLVRRQLPRQRRIRPIEPEREAADVDARAAPEALQEAQLRLGALALARDA